MPTRTYTIAFKDGTKPAINGAKALRAELVALDKQVAKVQASLKAFGGSASGLKAVAAALNSVSGAAKAAGTATAGLGKNTKTLAAYSNQIRTLQRQLAALRAQAAKGIPSPTITPGTAGTAGTGLPGTGGGGKAGALRSLAGGVAAAGVLGLARGAGQAVTRAGKEEREFYGEAAGEAKAYKESLLGLANLRQMPGGPTDAMVREQLQFSKETGLTPDAARDFQLEFEGAIGGAKGAGNITDPVARDLEKHLGTFAARYDLDPESAGRLGGILPLHKKINTGEEGAGIIAQMTEHLNLTGVGKVKTMIPAINAMSATMFDENGGRFTDPVQMAARYAATTLNSGGDPMVARSMMERTNKTLRDFANPKIGAALGEMGITLQDDYESAIRKAGAHFDKLKEQGIDPGQWMAAHGIKNSVARRDLISQAGINKVVDAQNADVRVKMKGTNVLQANEAFAATDVGKERALANQEFATDIETGMANQGVDAARRKVREEMARIDPKTGRQSLKASGVTSLIDRFVNFTTGKSGEDTRVDLELMDRLDAAGRATGKWGYFHRPSDSLRWMDMDTEGFRNEYTARSAEVRAAGGDPLTGGKLSQKARQAEKAMGDLAKAAADLERGGGGGGGGGETAPAFDPKRR